MRPATLTRWACLEAVMIRSCTILEKGPLPHDGDAVHCASLPCETSSLRAHVQAIEILIERQSSEALGHVVHVSGPAASASTGAVASEHPDHNQDTKQHSSADAMTPSGEQSAGTDSQRRPPRNKSCPCGSGAKYKNCCAAVAAAAQRRQQAAIEAGHEAGVRVDQMQTLYL